MGDTIVISHKMTDSIIPNIFLLNPGIRSTASFYYFGIDLNTDALAPITPQTILSESYLTMLASEDVLRKDWDDPLEDAAWANL